MQNTPMTHHGYEALQAELAHLKSKVRPEVIQAIAEARAHGDLRENAEYHAAREQQSFVEGRIAEIESKLATAQVIDITKLSNDGRVVFGSTVHLRHEDTGESTIYQIVGDDESDIKEQKISVNTPIARAIIGKYEGDLVNVQTPSGMVAYEIEQVEYI